MSHKYTGKFIPYTRNNLPEKMPQIVYESQQLQELSKQARLRLKWLIYYYKHGKNASLTSRYYGISRKTFYINQTTGQIRPRHNIGYLTPMEFLKMKKEKNLAGKVSPMYPTCTFT